MRIQEIMMDGNSVWKIQKSPATSYSPTANRSTIGVGGLNFRVRDGNGWSPSTMVTRLIIFHGCTRIVPMYIRKTYHAGTAEFHFLTHGLPLPNYNSMDPTGHILI